MGDISSHIYPYMFLEIKQINVKLLSYQLQKLKNTSESEIVLTVLSSRDVLRDATLFMRGHFSIWKIYCIGNSLARGVLGAFVELFWVGGMPLSESEAEEYKDKGG